MARFPKEGKHYEIGHELKDLPVPLPCLRSLTNNRGPGRNKFSGEFNVFPASREDLDSATTQRPMRAIAPK
jgi:hypothetical protein